MNAAAKCHRETYGDVESGDGELVLTSIVEDLVDVLSGDDTGGNNVKNTHSGVVAKSQRKAKHKEAGVSSVSVICSVPESSW